MSKKKNKLIFIFLWLYWLLSSAYPAWAEPEISAEAAIVMDLYTGEIIYEKAAFEQRPPASLTKVMTAYLALKLGDLQEIADISPYAAATGESTLNLKAGEQINLENLLYGALLRSANDSCVAIAELVAGEEERFVEMMNLQGKLLGCQNTQFCNTNGLPDPEHYSSAYDLALITRAALQEPVFRQIVAEKEKVVVWKGSRQQKVKNTNRLLTEYPGAIGVKTGTTNAAGQCLIGAARLEEKEVVVVILKSKNRFADAKKLLDYGLKQEELKTGGNYADLEISNY